LNVNPDLPGDYLCGAKSTLSQRLQSRDIPLVVKAFIAPGQLRPEAVIMNVTPATY